MESQSGREALKNEYYRRVGLNPSYSLRAFARFLKLSPGELSEILRGQRPLTVKSALKFVRALGLAEGEVNSFIAQVHTDAMKAQTGVADLASSERQLSVEMFQVISEWYCLAILNLAETPDFKFDPEWISSRLGIAVAQAKVGLERLERVGLIERVKGKLRVTPDFVLSTAGVPSEAIRKYHHTMLKKAEESLEFQSIEERDISGLQFATHHRNIKALKKEISDFQKRLYRKYSIQEKFKKTEVMHLEVALFKITKGIS